MARPLRIERAGAWYHITVRSNGRSAIYRETRDYQYFCQLLAEAVDRFRWRVHAYALMPHHFELLVETSEANLSASMQWFGVSYTVWFNLNHRRNGHLFPGRFKAIILDPVEWGLALSRYVHLTPLRAAPPGRDKSARLKSQGIGAPKPGRAVVRERLGRLRSFAWSSYRAYAGLAKSPRWLVTEKVLELAGRKKRDQQLALYRQYTEQAVREGLEQNPWEHVHGQVILGSGKFLRQMRKILSGGARKQPSRRGVVARRKWESVVKAIEELKGERWKEFQNRHGDWGRDLALYFGRKRCQLKLGELGRFAGGIEGASVAVAVARLGGQMKKDRGLAEAMTKLDAKLTKSQE